MIRFPVPGAQPPAAFAAVRYSTQSGPAGHHPALTRLERASLGHVRGPERAAAILAAKQAVQRLVPGLRAQDIEVLRRQHSAPVLRVRGISGGELGLSLSLSHGDGLAVAAVLVVGEGIPCAR